MFFYKISDELFDPTANTCTVVDSYGGSYTINPHDWEIIDSTQSYSRFVVLLNGATSIDFSDHSGEFPLTGMYIREDVRSLTITESVLEKNKIPVRFIEDPFCVNYYFNLDWEVSRSDKSMADILEAYRAGKKITCRLHFSDGDSVDGEIKIFDGDNLYNSFISCYFTIYELTDLSGTEYIFFIGTYVDNDNDVFESATYTVALTLYTPPQYGGGTGLE